MFSWIGLQQSLILTAQILAVLITKLSSSVRHVIKKKKNCVFHLKTTSCREYQFKSFTQSFRQGGANYLKKQSIGWRGVLFHMLCNYKKYILNYRICGRDWKLLALRLGGVKPEVWISEKLSTSQVFIWKRTSVISIQIKDNWLFMLSNMFYGLAYFKGQGCLHCNSGFHYVTRLPLH